MPNKQPDLSQWVSIIAVMAIILAVVFNIAGCKGQMRTENKEVEVVKL